MTKAADPFGIDYARIALSDYDALRRLPGVAFGWEFLRRNAAFQRDWAAWESSVEVHTEVKNDVVIRRLATPQHAAGRWGLVHYPFR